MATATPPTGTVTFLFTDIEGSTKLWEAHPANMQIALAKHDALTRQAIENANGHVFKTIGDAFCAAFSTAPEAVEAALAIQLALKAENWPEPTTIKARIALHTGDVEARADDYFGPPVNRVARLLAIGHGGQILLSEATFLLARDSLPVSAELANQGDHQLKDLAKPETVYQLIHPLLPSTFPPLKSLGNPSTKHNLHSQLTSFIGREKELAEIERLLDKTRALTLAGSGGAGKTRLALQAAADRVDEFRDGVWFVELAPLSDPELVARTVAGVLEVGEEAGKSALQSLTASLKHKNLLLVLDNCEHVLEATAKLAADLLAQCPNVRILATSRESLGISGEITFRVPSLSLPDPQRPQTIHDLSQYEAVHLFVDRASQAQTTFAITSANATALASICHRLDGIPLAIELAAARVKSLSVEDIDRKLDERFRLLIGGSRTVLPRQRTLRSLIDWSYELLNEPEKLLLARLSVFSGGWTLESAEAVCNGEPIEDWEVLDLLTSLVDKSLVISETSGPSARFRMLQTVKQYARDRMLESGEEEVWRSKHLAHFLSLAEAQEVLVHDATALDRLEVEQDNLRSALDWSEASDERVEENLRLCGALWRFWSIRGHYAEGMQRLTRALASELATNHPARRKVLGGASTIANWQCDFTTAMVYAEESLAEARSLGDQRRIAASLNAIGFFARRMGDYAKSRSLLEECLPLQREFGTKNGIATALGNLGETVFFQGDNPLAKELIQESLALSRELNDAGGTANALRYLGTAEHADGEFAPAQKLFVESLSMYRELGFLRGIVSSLEGLASVSADCDSVQRAARLWGAAAALRDKHGLPLPPGERVRYDSQLAAARAADATFDASWAEGWAMSMDAAIELALRDPAG